MNPILVREVRRCLRGLLVPASLTLVQGAGLAVALTARAGEGDRVLERLLEGFLVLAGIAIPVHAMDWDRRERKSGSRPLLALTGVGESAMAWGRIAAGLVPLALVASAMAPFLAFAYLLGGLSLGRLAMAGSTIVLVSVTSLLFAMAIGHGDRSAAAQLVRQFLFAAVAAGVLRELDDAVFGPSIHLLGIVVVLSLAFVYFLLSPERRPPAAIPGGVSVRLRGLAFDLRPGEILGIVGPNGSGKTNLLRMLATLILPVHGEVRYGGLAFLDAPDSIRRTIGYVPDRPGLDSGLTALECLDVFARAYGFQGERRRRAVAEVVAFAGLAPVADRLATRLSRGMEQRLVLARAIVHDPQLLLLDEPMQGLDPRGRLEFRELLRALAARGTSIAIASHVLPELEDLVDRLLVLPDGVFAEPRTRIALRSEEDAVAAERLLRERPEVVSVIRSGSDLIVGLAPGREEPDRLVHALLEAGIRVKELRRTFATGQACS